MKIDKERLIEMRVAGMSTAEIAKEFGAEPQAVTRSTRILLQNGELEGGYQEGFWRPESHPSPSVPPSPEEEGDCSGGVADRAASIDAADYIAEKHLQLDEEEPDAVGTPKKVQAHPYPMGVMSRSSFWQRRRDDLRRAICEYACEWLVIDPEWVEEYNELILSMLSEKKYT